jgi:hypothetical protein
MLPAVVPVSEIDRRIVEAYRDLAAARSAFSQFPSGAAITACQAAQTRLNDLLDERFDRMITSPGVHGRLAS